MKQHQKRVYEDGIHTINYHVKKIIAACQPVAVKQNSFFVNNVPSDISLCADEKTFLTLLGNTLFIIACSGKDSCIKISAKKYNDVLLMHIRDTNTFNSYAVLSKLQYLKMLARKMAGFLDITSISNRETTISFSFVNKKNNYLFDNDCPAFNDTDQKHIGYESF